MRCNKIQNGTGEDFFTSTSREPGQVNDLVLSYIPPLYNLNDNVKRIKVNCIHYDKLLLFKKMCEVLK